MAASCPMASPSAAAAPAAVTATATTTPAASPMVVPVTSLASRPKETYQPQNIKAGTPSNTLEEVYTDKSGQFTSGFWSSTEGKWYFEQGVLEEFCSLIEGEAELTSVDGQRQVVRAGEALIIPAGFKGTWETVKPLKKFYAVWDRSAKPPQPKL